MIANINVPARRQIAVQELHAQLNVRLAVSAYYAACTNLLFWITFDFIIIIRETTKKAGDLRQEDEQKLLRDSFEEDIKKAYKKKKTNAIFGQALALFLASGAQR